MSALAVAAPLVFAMVEMCKAVLWPAAPPRAAKALAWLLSAALVWWYRLDFLGSAGLAAPWGGVQVAANATLLALAAMGAHDLSALMRR
ncbi:MAG: hypothetical protein QN183_13755 [Armatimonadota bacterium]|nr:hypothetical protein [Armatimonadota bacterium]